MTGRRITAKILHFLNPSWWLSGLCIENFIENISDKLPHMSDLWPTVHTKNSHLITSERQISSNRSEIFVVGTGANCFQTGPVSVSSWNSLMWMTDRSWELLWSSCSLVWSGACESQHSSCCLNTFPWEILSGEEPSGQRQYTNTFYDNNDQLFIH